MIIRNKNYCTHEWVAIQGATICVQCGSDLDQILSLYRKNGDPLAAGIHVAVDRDQQLEAEPPVPPVAVSLALWVKPLLYVIAVLVGAVLGRILYHGLIAVLP